MNILCKLGLHKKDLNRHARVKRTNGKHTWYTNYVICARCDKILHSYSEERRRRKEKGW